LSEITLKCTRYSELPDNFYKLYVKDNDDNARMETLKAAGRYDKLVCIDNDVHTTNFFIVKIEGVEADIVDGDFRVHQLVISCSHKEET
jgi:hypothetical protein